MIFETIFRSASYRAGLAAAVLLLLVLSVQAAGAGEKFDKTLELKGITFHVTCPNQGSLNDVTIVPSGLEQNTPITIKEADGTVTGAEVADLNRDVSPELYIFLTSAGSGSYANLIAFSANNNKSLSEIHLPELMEDKVNSRGYMGHDRFAVSGEYLVRNFPLYKDDDTNAEPTGGTRTLHYTLVPGEATWQLKLVKSTDK